MSQAHGAALGAVLEAMHSEAKRRRRAAWISVFAAAAVAALVVALAGERHGPLHSMVAAGAVSFAAALLAWGRRSGRVLVAAGLCSIALTSVFAAASGLRAADGLHCLFIELGTALLPCAAVLGAMLRNRDPVDAALLMQTAATAALSGQAALVVVCPAHDALGHTLVFHNASLLLAALLAGGIARWARQRQRHGTHLGEDTQSRAT